MPYFPLGSLFCDNGTVGSSGTCNFSFMPKIFSSRLDINITCFLSLSADGFESYLRLFLCLLTFFLQVKCCLTAFFSYFLMVTQKIIFQEFLRCIFCPFVVAFAMCMFQQLQGQIFFHPCALVLHNLRLLLEPWENGPPQSAIILVRQLIKTSILLSRNAKIWMCFFSFVSSEAQPS